MTMLYKNTTNASSLMGMGNNKTTSKKVGGASSKNTTLQWKTKPLVINTTAKTTASK